MLRAYLARKLPSDTKDIRAREDPLTSTVFERLGYLPAETAWSVVFRRSALAHGRLDAWSQEFWPNWPASDGGPQQTVAPDVVWARDGRPALVFEVKWLDSQTLEQLTREARAAEDLAGDTAVVMVGLGGWSAERKAEVRAGWRLRSRLIVLDWADVNHNVRELLRASADEREKRVLEDLVLAFADRGMLDWQWIEGLVVPRRLGRAGLPNAFGPDLGFAALPVGRSLSASPIHFPWSPR